MSTKQSNPTVNKLRRLADGEEITIEGAVWMKLAYTREYKVSPHGLAGDYDKDSYFVSYEDLEDLFN